MDLASVQPVEFYKAFLDQKIRPDGRELMETRPIVLNVGAVRPADGSTLVKLGETMVICGVKAELAVPAVEEPCKGIIVPNLELPPLCSSNFKAGPPCEQAQVITKFLDNLLKTCTLVDTSELCIKKDKLVWVLYCDLICLNYDGNVLDASVIALTAALQNVQLPDVTIDDETDTPSTNHDIMTPLTLKCSPTASTFTLFQGSTIIADPTSKEEQITQGKLSVVTNENGYIMYIERTGGVALAEEEVQTCIKKAIEHSKEVRKLYDAVKS